ncbi:MAG: hypothetical protein ACTHQM_13820, partial [Thermoanaerobaculia bacterium]
MFAALLDRLTNLLLRRPKLILAVAAIITLISGLAALRLRLDPDVLNLIPRSNREVNEFRDLLKETGTLDFHVIVVELPKGSDPSAYYPLLDSLGEELGKSEHVENVTWRVPDVFSMVDKVVPYSLLLLRDQQLDVVQEKLSDEGIRAAVARNAALLQTPQSAIAKQLVRIDPFNLLPIYMDKVQRAGGGLKIDLASGYYLSADHTAAIIVARPKRAAQDLPFSRVMMEETRAITALVEAKFKAANPSVPLPEIGYTGGYAIAAADEHIIRRDMTINSISSMIGVMLLYLYAYRRPSAVIYASVPMAAAIIITFGLG